jgi:hypothetical protein
MDKDEYRAYRETVIRRTRQEEERKKATENAFYSSRGMNVARMPLGCWIWVAIAVAVACALIKASGVLH